MLDCNIKSGLVYRGQVTIGITDEPIISLRSEMMGEGKDDWEYLKLIEKRFGKDMAINVANIVAKRPGPLGSGNVDEEGIYRVRDFIGRKLERKTHKFQDNFADLNWISKAENLRTDMTHDGSVQLDYATPPVLIEGFENLTQWKTRGPVKASFNYDRKTAGNSSTKVVFNKGRTNPLQLSFSSTKLSVTDWSDYNFLEFDVYAELDLSLFDVSITFNN